ncbi:MAG: hypothetical protein WC683_02420 [bacterium]
MNALGAAFGIYDPAKVVRAAKNFMAVTGGDVSTHVVAARAGLRGLGADPAPAPAPATSTAGAGTVLAVVGGIVLVVVALRGAAGWYIGKQFKRPYLGIAAGAIGGAPGLGILSLFPGR